MDDDVETFDFEANGFDENSYQITDNVSIPVYADVQRYPCPICSRSFNAESLRKHQPICQKSSQKAPRRTFDTGKQRAAESDVPYAATRETTKFYNEGVKPKADISRKSNNHWREDHQTLVETIRQARQVNQNSTPTQTKPTVKQATNNSDYIQCEFCQRLFNKYSAERHIPFCETQFKRKQLQSNGVDTRSTVRTLTRPGRLQAASQQQAHPINSAPSSFISKFSPSLNNGKSARKPLTNSVTLRRTQNNEVRVEQRIVRAREKLLTRPTPTKTKNLTPPKVNNFRAKKTSMNPSQYLLGMMKNGRTTGSEETNVSRSDRPNLRKGEASPRVPGQSSENSTRSPSPNRRAHTNGDSSSQEFHVSSTNSIAKHCHQCGKSFPVDWAKFCCECGQKRFGIE